MSDVIKMILGIDISEVGYAYCLVANNPSFGTQQLLTVGTEKPSENIPEDIVRIIHIVGKYCLKGVPDKLLLDEVDYRKIKRAVEERLYWQACDEWNTICGVAVERV